MCASFCMHSLKAYGFQFICVYMYVYLYVHVCLYMVTLISWLPLIIKWLANGYSTMYINVHETVWQCKAFVATCHNLLTWTAVTNLGLQRTHTLCPLGHCKSSSVVEQNLWLWRCHVCHDPSTHKKWSDTTMLYTWLQLRNTVKTYRCTLRAAAHSCSYYMCTSHTTRCCECSV